MALYDTIPEIFFSYFLFLFFALPFIFQKHYISSRSKHAICFSMPLKMVPLLSFSFYLRNVRSQLLLMLAL